jgi:hypothetical protein
MPFLENGEWQEPERNFLNVWYRQRVYGGPEEGGWWTDVDNIVVAIPVSDLTTEEQDSLMELIQKAFGVGDARRDLMSVNGEGMYVYAFDEERGKDSPLPRYE